MVKNRRTYDWLKTFYFWIEIRKESPWVTWQRLNYGEMKQDIVLIGFVIVIFLLDLEAGIVVSSTVEGQSARDDWPNFRIFLVIRGINEVNCMRTFDCSWGWKMIAYESKINIFEEIRYFLMFYLNLGFMVLLILFNFSFLSIRQFFQN